HPFEHRRSSGRSGNDTRPPRVAPRASSPWTCRCAVRPRLRRDGNVRAARDIQSGQNHPNPEMSRPLTATPLHSSSAAAHRPQSAGDDLDLVRRIAPGDISAFERLPRRFNRPLYRVARAIIKDDAEAEDVLQEAMLRAYRAMQDFRGDSFLSTWLERIPVKKPRGRLTKKPP